MSCKFFSNHPPSYTSHSLHSLSHSVEFSSLSHLLKVFCSCFTEDMSFSILLKIPNYFWYFICNTLLTIFKIISRALLVLVPFSGILLWTPCMCLILFLWILPLKNFVFWQFQFLNYFLINDWCCDFAANPFVFLLTLGNYIRYPWFSHPPLIESSVSLVL